MVVLEVTAFTFALSRKPETSTNGVGANVLAFLENAGASEYDEFLKYIRPAKLNPAVKARIIATLPPEGEVQASAAGMSKLAALEPIFKYHDRSSEIDIKLIQVLQAFVGLHARSVVLISEKALNLVTAEELQALVAHEMGHEYFWNEYQSASGHGDCKLLQEVELRCDAIAVITICRLGLDPESLISATAKLMQFNERIGATANANSYVSQQERVKFIRTMATLVRTRLATGALRK